MQGKTNVYVAIAGITVPAVKTNSAKINVCMLVLITS